MNWQKSLFFILHSSPFSPFCFNCLKVWKEYKFSTMSHYLLIQACFRAMACEGLGYSKAMQPLPAGQDFPQSWKSKPGLSEDIPTLHVPCFKMMLPYFLFGCIIVFGKKKSKYFCVPVGRFCRDDNSYPGGINRDYGIIWQRRCGKVFQEGHFFPHPWRGS